MEHKEPWALEFGRMWDDPSFGGVVKGEVKDFIRRTLASSRDAALAEAMEVVGRIEQTKEWVDAGENKVMREQHRVGYNKGVADSAAALSALREKNDL